MNSAHHHGPDALPASEDGLSLAPNGVNPTPDAPPIPAGAAQPRAGSPVPPWLSGALAVWMQEPGDNAALLPGRRPH